MSNLNKSQVKEIALILFDFGRNNFKESEFERLFEKTYKLILSNSKKWKRVK